MNLKQITCNLCGAKVEKVLFDWGSTSVMQCENCHLIFRRIVADLSQEDLFAFLDIEKGGDFSRSPTAKYDAHYQRNDKRIMMWKDFLSEFARLKCTDSSSLLDIGSAKGVFLDIARKNGWEPMGVDPSEDYTAYAREVFDLPVQTTTLEAAGFCADSFDVATMWDVIEHLQDPARTVAEAFRVLKPGGLLFVLTPNNDSLIAQAAGWLYRLSGRRFPLERYLYTMVHLYFFTPRTLCELLRRAGFNIEKAGNAPLSAERCLMTSGAVRAGASVLDAIAKLFGKGYRISILASKPLDQGQRG